MNSVDNEGAPLGVILISFFWILVGTLFLLMMQSFFQFNSPLIFIFIFLGTFFVFLGWGLLTLKKWAWSISLIISIIGLVPMLYIIPTLIYGSIGGSLSNMMCYSTFLLFLPIILYLIKKQKIFSEKQSRCCFLCGRNILQDAKICPYCAKNLDELAIKDDINAIKRS